MNRKKKEPEMFTTKETLKGKEATWKDTLTMLALVGFVVFVAIALMALAGCKTNDYEWEANTSYHYYVIDLHSDIPDAKFNTMEEAATYQNKFSEHHDYIILYCNGEKRFSVYSMEKPY